MKWKHTIIIAASITLIGTAAYAVVPILAKSIQWTTSSSTPCAAGTSCMWAKTSDGLPYWHKTDNTNTALIGGGGTVSADSPLTGDGSGGSHLACATCVVTGGSTFVGANTFSGTQIGTYSLGGTPSLAANLTVGTNILKSSGDVNFAVNGSSTANVEFSDAGGGAISLYLGAKANNDHIYASGNAFQFLPGNTQVLALSTSFIDVYKPVVCDSDGLTTLGIAGLRFSSAYVGSTGADGTCDSSHRGQFRTFFAAGGAADKFRVCMKAVADTYSWVDVGTAP